MQIFFSSVDRLYKSSNTYFNFKFQYENFLFSQKLCLDSFLCYKCKDKGFYHGRSYTKHLLFYTFYANGKLTIKLTASTALLRYRCGAFLPELNLADTFPIADILLQWQRAYLLFFREFQAFQPCVHGLPAVAYFLPAHPESLQIDGIGEVGLQE